MNTYIVPLIIEDDPRGGGARTANVEPGVSWVGQPIDNDRYLIRSPHEMEDLPPGRERGERQRLNAQQMRDIAVANGLDPGDVEDNWRARGD